MRARREARVREFLWAANIVLTVLGFALTLAAFVGLRKSEIDELLAGRRRSLLPHPWLLAYGLVAFAFATLAQWIEMSWGR
jgi:hypothetical protein